jgi:hypothetical protein
MQLLCWIVLCVQLDGRYLSLKVLFENLLNHYYYYYYFAQPLNCNWQRDTPEPPPTYSDKMLHSPTLNCVHHLRIAFFFHCKIWYGHISIDEIKLCLYLYHTCVASYLSGRNRYIIQQTAKARSRRGWKAPHILLFGRGVFQQLQ